MQEEIAWLADMAKRFHQAASIIDEIVEVKQVIEALELNRNERRNACRIL
ncbi:MAG: hypothetical protein ACLUD0_08765 [Eubacterium ramulus]